MPAEVYILIGLVALLGALGLIVRFVARQCAVALGAAGAGYRAGPRRVRNTMQRI